MPKVSICLPSLNTYPFLRERLDSILAQTLIDWELIVNDSFSNDGSWKLFQEYAKRDSRIRLYQTPPDGIYPAWNFCIKKTMGDYIYIATSDDSMMPDCLEKMVIALEDHPECDICHCKLLITDKDGVPNLDQRWEEYDRVKYFGDWINQKHIRYAPHDGVLTFFFGTVYQSMTQVLIRRSAFEKIGLFRSDWGGIGDVEWQMRAGMFCNAIHIPETLATWRMYAGQGSEVVHQKSLDEGWLYQMGQAALESLKSIDQALYYRLEKASVLDFLKHQYDGQKVYQLLKKSSSRPRKLLKLICSLFTKDRSFVIPFLMERSFRHHSASGIHDRIQKVMCAVGVQKLTEIE